MKRLLGSSTIKILIILLLISLLIFMFAFIFIKLALPTQIHKGFATKNIAIIKEESYFSGFKVIDNMVYIFCRYTIENKSDETVYFELIANMPKEQKKGLLTESNLIAFGVEGKLFNEVSDEDNKAVPVIADSPVFNINAHRTQEYYVVYIGEYGGTKEKEDRLLPITSLVEVYQ